MSVTGIIPILTMVTSLLEMAKRGMDIYNTPDASDEQIEAYRKDAMDSIARSDRMIAEAVEKRRREREGG